MYVLTHSKTKFTNNPKAMTCPAGLVCVPAAARLHAQHGGHGAPAATGFQAKHTDAHEQGNCKREEACEVRLMRRPAG